MFVGCCGDDVGGGLGKKLWIGWGNGCGMCEWMGLG